MLTRPTRLEPKQDKQSTKWHHIRGGYLALFDPNHVDHVEKWYNTIAPSRHRDNFRAVMKGIVTATSSAAAAAPLKKQLQNAASESSSQHATTTTAAAAAGGSVTNTNQELNQCKAENLMRLYGMALSPSGRDRARLWILGATTSELDAFRDVFTGIQSLFTLESQMKSTFKYRPLPDIPPTNAHRQKIDWSNTHAAELAQKHLQERTASAPQGLSNSNLPSRGSTAGTDGGRAPKARPHHVSALADQGTEQKIAALKEKRMLYQQSDKYNVDPKTGCSTFTATSSSPRRDINSKARVMASFQEESTHGWISTTREMIRNYGTSALLHVERVVRDEHPAIALTTASVGLCVPSRN